MSEKKYTKTEVQEGERKKEKLISNLKELSDAVADIYEEIEEGKQELEDIEDLDKKDELSKFVSEVEYQVANLKHNLKLESDRVSNIVLDYDDLKTEPLDPVFKDNLDEIRTSIQLNGPLMGMFIEYLNYLNYNKLFQEKTGVEIKYIFNDAFGFENKINTNISSVQKYDKFILIKFKNTEIVVSLKKFIQDGKIQHTLDFSSKGRTYLNENYLYKKLLFNSVSHSSVKGKFITMKPESLYWEYEILEKRDFSDIYLPKSNFQDLQLYLSLFEKSGRLLRYLLIGNPGTGKTEATIAMANLLKRLGVTVIKTNVCSKLKEKIELAELLSPSILLIDDIDLSLGSRSRGMVSGHLQDFLNILDGTQKLRKDVGIMATTNSLELLDLAAQRPGRFDKLVAFDSLEKENIRDIILKSLRYGFGFDADNEMAKMLVDKQIIDQFFNAGVTGAHIYNTANMLVAKIDTLELEGITVDWFLDQIKSEIKTLEKIKKASFLSDKMSRSVLDNGGGLGFGTSDYDNAPVPMVNDLPWEKNGASKIEAPQQEDASYLLRKSRD